MRLFGKNPVIERLRSEPESIKKIYIQEGFQPESYVRTRAKRSSIPLNVVPRTRMKKWGRNINDQGIMADVSEFEYVNYEDALDDAVKSNLTLFFLDSLNDPQNFGAMIRSMGCLGGFVIVLPRRDSVSVTEAVLRVASGGDNHVAIARVNNLSNAIRRAKEMDFTIWGASAGDGEDINVIDFCYPIGVIIGSEQKGIRPVLMKHIDKLITIPMAVKQLSFNVGHAATIIAYEIKRQKDAKK